MEPLAFARALDAHYGSNLAEIIENPPNYSYIFPYIYRPYLIFVLVLDKNGYSSNEISRLLQKHRTSIYNVLKKGYALSKDYPDFRVDFEYFKNIYKGIPNERKLLNCYESKRYSTYLNAIKNIGFKDGDKRFRKYPLETKSGIVYLNDAEYAVFCYELRKLALTNEQIALITKTVPAKVSKAIIVISHENYDISKDIGNFLQDVYE
jgi:hypothetical protein